MDNQNFNQPMAENLQIPPETRASKPKKKLLIIFGILVVVIVIIIIGFADFFYFDKDKLNKSKQPTSTPIDTEQPITIKSTIKTEFAEYKPYPVDITPIAESYTLPVDLDKIKNKKKFDLDNSKKQKLSKQGFVAIPTNYDKMYSIYKYNTKNGRPNFVTIDSVLHTFHILYDYTLRNLEINKFLPDLKNLTKVLLQNTLSQYRSITDPKLKYAAKKNIAYFAVALKLLEPETTIPPDVKDFVEQELNLIENHSGFHDSPIFGYKEDYSQYIPRGHYTRNEDFKKYFKTMMWYGRMMFRVESPNDKEKDLEEIRQALLISLILSQSKVNQEEALTVFDRIYQPTVFFIGKTDDLNVYDYLRIARKILGENIKINDLSDKTKIDKFISEVKALSVPKISSSFVLDIEDTAKVNKAFRFIGQRFIPDSYIFQQLVFLNYKGDDSFLPFTAAHIQRGIMRVFPRGLDIAAVLGSQRAKEILDNEKDSFYEEYEERLRKLKNEFSSLPQEQWCESLYWNWLYTLLPTLTIKGSGYPIFMQQTSWLDKDLNSFLGSWTELRHDTILYAKQIYTLEQTSIEEVPKQKLEDRGYVEPNPEVYARLASLVRFMREGLRSKNLLIGEYKNKLARMEEVLLTLKTISEKELTNKDLKKNDYNFIKNIGDTLEDLVTFSAEERERITSETDTKMEIIVDVHTDSNTAQVLEEGVGKPMTLFVVVKEGGDLYLTSGPIFSYYEFRHSMSDRLNDEKWQQMIKPPLPSFVQSFIVK